MKAHLKFISRIAFEILFEELPVYIQLLQIKRIREQTKKRVSFHWGSGLKGLYLSKLKTQLYFHN